MCEHDMWANDSAGLSGVVIELAWRNQMQVKLSYIGHSADTDDAILPIL